MVIVKRFLQKNKFLVIFSVFLVLLFLVLFFFFRKHIIFSVVDQDSVIEVQSDYVIENVSACYGNKFRCESIDVDVHSDVDTSHLGVYDVSYTASYGKHNSTFVKKIHVVDRSNPVINVSSDSLSICPNSDSYDIKYNAFDNYDGDISSLVSRDVSDDRLILSVSDSSGNSDSKTISLVREDKELPIINLVDSQNMYIPVGSNFSDPGFTASDNCDGDITSNVVVSGSVDSSSPGTYTIDYSVSDSSGNSVSISRSVNVYVPNNNGDKVIYLTFDDGPSQYTGELLDILSKYDVKATFFVTGMKPDYFNYIGEAYRRGHSIGIHTSSHNYSLVYSSADAFFNDVNSINDVIYNQTGSYSNILRFPGGSSNTVSRFNPGIMSNLSRMVEEKGFKYFDWNVSSGDASSNILSSDVYANNIINGLGNGTNYVVLQHDTNINSIRAVSTVIEYGLAHGYSFKALDVNGPIVHHRIVN